MDGTYTIVFGDIVNIWQLLSKSDKLSEEILSKHKTLIHSIAEKYNGKVLDLFTDSSKIIFDNPRNGINYCREVFRRFSIEPRIPYRASISHGTISYNEDGIFGEAAKIASGLVNNCPEGAVLLTEELVNHLPVPVADEVHAVGSIFIKGIEAPLKIYCLTEDGFYIPAQGELTEKQQNKNTIAILPFHNISSDKELDYICDGLAEEVIDRLTKSKDLFVTARSSSFMFKNKEMSILDISRKLNVSHILEGSIRKRNKDYRISYQLVDCSNGYNAISDTITTSFDNLYNTESKISSSIIQYLKNDDSTEEIDKEDFYIDPTAYQYYLKGRYLSFQWKKKEAIEAIEYFTKALEIVPDYALAYSGLSVSYIHCAVSGFIDYNTAITNAVKYAEKSIESDETRHEGYVAKALASFWRGYWYVPDFEENISKALNISPSNAEIRMFKGMLYLLQKGDLENASIELKLAHELDPYSNLIIIRLGLVQYLNREYQEAYNTFTNMLQDPDYRAYTSIRLAWCCMMMKDFDRALYHLTKEHEEYEYYNMVYAAYLYIYSQTKNEEAFFKYKTIIEELPQTDPTYFYNHAVLYKVLGKPDISIDYLKKSMQNPMMLFMFIHLDEFWEEYLDHPDFIALINEKYNKGKKKQIVINSETRESIEMNPDEFVYAEAQDNYTLIVLKKDAATQEKILRATLSSIEKQLDQAEVIRCHRSYLINKNTGFRLLRENGKTCLKHEEFNIRIPVSRSKEKDIRELFGE
jgi:TolB-like protein